MQCEVCGVWFHSNDSVECNQSLMWIFWISWINNTGSSLIVNPRINSWWSNLSLRQQQSYQHCLSVSVDHLCIFFWTQKMVEYTSMKHIIDPLSPIVVFGPWGLKILNFVVPVSSTLDELFASKWWPLWRVSGFKKIQLLFHQIPLFCLGSGLKFLWVTFYECIVPLFSCLLWCLIIFVNNFFNISINWKGGSIFSSIFFSCAAENLYFYHGWFISSSLR